MATPMADFNINDSISGSTLAQNTLTRRMLGYHIFPAGFTPPGYTQDTRIIVFEMIRLWTEEV